MHSPPGAWYRPSQARFRRIWGWRGWRSPPDILLATILFLFTALGLGLGNGAIFKLVAQYFPKSTGLVTGIAGCAGGLGGFFPPLLLGFVRDATGNYALGFVLLAVVAVACVVVLVGVLRADSVQAATSR